MLAIRMQRTGRSGHAQFRVVVQDSRFSPTRGRVVAYLGNFNPHTKVVTLDSEKISQYLQNGAQPSDTVARLLQKEGIKLPAWVKLAEPKKKTVRHPEKRRSTRPPEASPADSTGQAAESKAPADQTAEPAPETETATESEAPVEESTSKAEPAEAETPSESEVPATESAPKATEEK